MGLLIEQRNMGPFSRFLVFPFSSVLLVVAILTGCNGDDSLIRVGVSVPETTEPVHSLMKQAMIDQGKEYNVEILWNGVGDDGIKPEPVAREIEQVQEMLKQGIKVLIFKSSEAKAAYPILKEAQRLEVSVITLDRLLIGLPVRGHIAVNEAGLGEAAAQYAVERIGYQGNVLVLEGPGGVRLFRNIAIGIYRVLDQYSGQIRVHSRISAPHSDTAFNLTDQMLKNYAGNIQAIIAVDSELAVGAVRGVQLHELTNQIVTVGVGAGEAACRQIISKQHDAEVDLMPYERGLEALNAAVEALNNQPFSYDVEISNNGGSTKTKFAQMRYITSANYLEIERMWPGLFNRK